MPNKFVRAFSRALLWLGAIVFLVGGKFLYEIKHLNFFSAEVIGIVIGLSVMLIGAGIIKVQEKSSRNS